MSKQHQLLESQDPDISKSFKEIVEDNGYVYEEHRITTEDGYILTLFRIPGTASEQNSDEIVMNRKKKVVFLQHGVMDSADCWVANRKEVAPAFILSDSGYDVWLGNSRGNKYSSQHIDPIISDQKYWAYSFQEMGDYDIPAAIEYIRKITGQKKLAYIGHSQGTAQMFYALATNQDYFADKITAFIALAPVTYISHQDSFILSVFQKNVELIMSVSKLFGIYDIFQPNALQSGSSKLLCGHIPDLCKYGGLISDEDLDINDANRVGVFFAHMPAGTSIRSLEHFSQIQAAGRFQVFDYGSKINLEKYGSEEPYEIPIDKISKVPIAMFVGNYDKMATVEDNKVAFEKMVNAVTFYQEYPLGHLAFLTAKDMSYFTQDVMNILRKYHPSKELKFLSER